MRALESNMSITRWAAIAFAGVLVHACAEPDEVAEDCEVPGQICTWAGNGLAGFNGDGLPLTESRLYWPVDVLFASTGEAYVLDWNNHRVRVVDDGGFRTVIGTDFVGDGPQDLSDLVYPGAPATEVALNHPTQLLEMSPGHFLLVAWHNHKLRTYDAATGLCHVACGRGAGFEPGDGPIEVARLNQPSAARIGPDGAIYLLDQRNQRIRRIDTLASGGTIQTVVGSGVAGYHGDGGEPLLAQVSFPPGSNPPPAGGLDFDLLGRLYFSDTLNDRVRRVDFAANTIETVLGDGTPQTLDNPRDIERGPDGRMYVADEGNHRIIALEPTSLQAQVVAGTGNAGDLGDYGPAIEAELNRPTGLAFDAAGNLYISDTLNNRIRVVWAPTEDSRP